MRLELARRFVNYLQAWDGTAVRLNTIENCLMFQRLTQFGLRMSNMMDSPMKNQFAAMRNPELPLEKLDSNSFVNLQGLATSMAK